VSAAEWFITGFAACGFVFIILVWRAWEEMERREIEADREALLRTCGYPPRPQLVRKPPVALADAREKER